MAFSGAFVFAAESLQPVSWRARTYANTNALEFETPNAGSCYRINHTLASDKIKRQLGRWRFEQDRPQKPTLLPTPLFVDEASQPPFNGILIKTTELFIYLIIDFPVQGNSAITWIRCECFLRNEFR